MKDDYLWDKSGEPDPEIQQLEEVLGTLRYQPRPLEMPADLTTDSKPRFFSGFAPRLVPSLAIAATLLMVLVGLGLWLGLQRLQRAHPPEVANNPNPPAPSGNPVASPSGSPAKDQNELANSSGRDQRHSEVPRRHAVNKTLLASNPNKARNRARKETVHDTQLADNEMQQGKAAKEQLMLALRVASAKLSFAQKKMQTASPRDPVHNQHKIG
jgi:hypothetical protein